jgi:hypothetical protein
MADFLEFAEWLPADPKRGRIRRAQIRIFFLEFTQFTHQRIINLVGHIRLVQHVVFVAALVNFRRQFFHPGFNFFFIHKLIIP